MVRLGRVFRKYHRLLSAIVFLPLVLMSLTGTISPILDALQFHQATALVRQIHSGKIFFGSAYLIYAVPSGLGLLGLLVTGLNLLGRFTAPSRINLKVAHRVKSNVVDVKDLQTQVAEQTNDIGLLLLLLLPITVRKHLINLAKDTAQNYNGTHSLREELFHLQSTGLILTVPERSIDQITDQSTFNLADYVQLSSLGRRWIHHIEELEGNV